MNEALHSISESPAPKLERVFEGIYRTRMHDFPLLNSRLRVVAVGFEICEHGWVGVVLTPWFMNLMVLPHPEKPWQKRWPGETVQMAFPSGVYEFAAGQEDEIGDYYACSLFSPVLEFEGHEAAMLAAQESMRLLLEPVTASQADQSVKGTTDDITVSAPVPMSRRAFLMGLRRGEPATPSNA